MTAAVTTRVTTFAHDALSGAVPEEIGHAVKRAMLDSIGVMVAGTRHPASRTVIAMVKGLGHNGRCRIVGSDHRTDPVNAALANGTTAHVLDWDDTILPTRAHLSAALLPPLMAAGEEIGWTIDDIVPAFAVGFEVAARINHAVYPAVHLRGWQGTGIAGGVGAAIATGRMIGLGVGQLAHATGIAATNGSGLIATFGSMSKALNIGRAGAAGLQSAYLAKSGFTSHPDILDTGKYLEMFDDKPRHDILLDGLGERWSILDNGYKLYPCGFVAHATIDAVRDLRVLAAGRTDLRHLTLRVSPESMHLMGNADPTNELEAKFSLLYDAAVAWTDGHVTPAAFEEAVVRDPRYRGVMAATEIVVSADVAQDEAFAEAEFETGPAVSVHVRHARGTKARPLTDADLDEKYAAAMAMGGSTHGAEVAALIRKGDVPIRKVLDHLSGG
jgi:2-methylcitrate dehydratase PrpD